MVKETWIDKKIQLQDASTVVQLHLAVLFSPLLKYLIKPRYNTPGFPLNVPKYRLQYLMKLDFLN